MSLRGCHVGDAQARADHRQDGERGKQHQPSPPRQGRSGRGGGRALPHRTILKRSARVAERVAVVVLIGGQCHGVGAEREATARDPSLEGNPVRAGSDGVGERATRGRARARDMVAVGSCGRQALPGNPPSSQALGEHQRHPRELIDRERERRADRWASGRDHGLAGVLAPRSVRPRHPAKRRCRDGPGRATCTRRARRRHDHDRSRGRGGVAERIGAGDRHRVGARPCVSVGELLPNAGLAVAEVPAGVGDRRPRVEGRDRERQKHADHFRGRDR